MKKYLWIFTVGLLSILVVTGCRRTARTGVAGGWEPVTPEADSLMAALAKRVESHQTITPSDSLIGRFRDMAVHAKRSERKALMTRWRFWRCVAFSLTDDQVSAEKELREAFATADSAARPYEFRRLRAEKIYLQQREGTYAIGPILNDYEFYLSRGDIKTAASMAMVTANAMGEAADLETARTWYLRGDSLLAVAGASRSRILYKLNYGAILFANGLKSEAADLYGDLLEDSLVRATPEVQDVLLRNAYLFTDNPTYLHSAYNRIRTLPGAENLAGLYEAMLARHLLSTGHPDSARFYIDKAGKHLPAIQNLSHRATYFDAASEVSFSEGQPGKAYAELRRYIAVKDSADSLENIPGLLNQHAAYETRILELEKREERQTMEIRLLIGALVLLTVIGGGIIYVLDMRRRNQIKAREARRDLEYERRRVAASAAAVRENVRLIEMIEKQLSVVDNPELRKRLEGELRDYASRSEELGMISDILQKACPNFTTNLQKAYPGISDMQIKLAGYILIGMGNKEIARFLNIRPESVRQSRWRLKAKLGVGDDSTLEDTLRTFNS